MHFFKYLYLSIHQEHQSATVLTLLVRGDINKINTEFRMLHEHSTLAPILQENNLKKPK